MLQYCQCSPFTNTNQSSITCTATYHFSSLRNTNSKQAQSDHNTKPFSTHILSNPLVHSTSIEHLFHLSLSLRLPTTATDHSLSCTVDRSRRHCVSSFSFPLPRCPSPLSSAPLRPLALPSASTKDTLSHTGRCERSHPTGKESARATTHSSITRSLSRSPHPLRCLALHQKERLSDWGGREAGVTKLRWDEGEAGDVARTRMCA